MKLLSNLKGSTSQKRKLNKNISFRYILKHNFSFIEFIKNYLSTRISEIRRIIVFHKDIIQIIDLYMTSVYEKPAFSAIFTNYENFNPTYQQRGLLHKLLHRSFSKSCDFKTLHSENDNLKTILMKKELFPEFHWFVY